MGFLRIFAKRLNPRERTVSNLVGKLTGRKPGNIDLYLKAFRHKSAAKNLYNGEVASNERLEFLGDAILDAIVANYLFAKYPDAEEGELTKIKSRIVSRSHLNHMARSMGLAALIETDTQAANSVESLSGNALEALFGALYLDFGYKRASAIVISLLEGYTDLETLEYKEADFKSRLYEVAHKERVELRFDTRPVDTRNGERKFSSEVYFKGTPQGKGEGTSKKRAEQEAARVALEKLGSN